jgi:ribosomal protein L34
VARVRATAEETICGRVERDPAGPREPTASTGGSGSGGLGTGDWLMKVRRRSSKVKKKKVSGYLARRSSKAGRKILKRRRQRGRAPTSL